MYDIIVIEMSKKKTLTIRNVSPELADALLEEKKRRGKSVNSVVLELLSHGLGIESGHRRSNGLSQLAGRWTQKDLEEFEVAVKAFDEIDEELWK
jgi:hypothetical protein